LNLFQQIDNIRKELEYGKQPKEEIRDCEEGRSSSELGRITTESRQAQSASVENPDSSPLRVDEYWQNVTDIICPAYRLGS
jgi:hypothetical protein